MKSGEDEVRASVWYGSFIADPCESLALSPFTSESFQALGLKRWGKKKSNLMLKKVLSSAKATASLIPPCQVVPPGFLLLVLPRCVSVILVDRAALPVV